jgi:hypothetical protein
MALPHRLIQGLASVLVTCAVQVAFSQPQPGPPPQPPVPAAPPLPAGKFLSAREEACRSYVTTAYPAAAVTKLDERNGDQVYRRAAASALSEKVETLLQVQSTPETVPVETFAPPATDGQGATGLGAETIAVNPVAPTQAAAGNVAFAGTNAGSRMVASFSLNPLVLIADPTDQKQLAKASRLWDLGVVLPIDANGDVDKTKVFDYVGVRARVNFAGLGQGDAAFKGAIAAYTALYQAEASRLAAILALLESTNDVPGCIKAIVDASLDRIKAVCGAELDVTKHAKLEGDARSKLDDALAAADRTFFGLDLRADFGDPMFTDDMAADGVFVTAAVALGRRTSTTGRSFAYNLRVGYSYADDADRIASSVDFGAGVAYAAGERGQQVQVSLGVEGRWKVDSEGVVEDEFAQLDTNFVEVHFGVSVPLAEGKALSVGGSVPIAGNRGPVLTVSGDWSVLLGSIAAGK